MPKIIPPVRFAACGHLQFYIIPETGSYLLEARGAQGGGEGLASGGRGAFLRGLFHLREGEIINLVVGRAGLAGSRVPALSLGAAPFLPHDEPETTRGAGGGGGTFIWSNGRNGLLPDWPLLAAAGGGGGGNGPGGDGLVSMDANHGLGPGGRNGLGGSSDLGAFYYNGGGGTGWFGDGANGAGPTYCQGGTQWHGGTGARFGGYLGADGGFGGGGGGSFFGAGAGGGGGFSGGAGGGGRIGTGGGGGGGSYNRGREQQNLAGFQSGDGSAAILFLSAPLKVSVSGNPFLDASDFGGSRRPTAELAAAPRAAGH